VGEYPTCVACADLDDDGDIDVVVANGSSGTVSILLNGGDGTFALQVDYDVGNEPWFIPSLVAADLDGDGFVDLAVPSYNTDHPFTVNVLHNTGHGRYVRRGQYTVHGPGEIARADLNGDGAPDLVVTDQTMGALSVFMNDGHGNFAPFVWYLLSAFPHSLAIADLDDDGAPDLITGISAHRLDVLRNVGHGVFADPVEFRVGSWPASIAAADLDGDGDVDLAVPNFGPDSIAVLRNCASSGVVFCAGDGSGTACPCSNESTPGSGVGCLHSGGLGGALRASGSAQLAHDELVLTASSLPQGYAMFVQGTARANGGAGTAFGDGLRCAGGRTVSLSRVATAGGTASFPDHAADATVSSRGGVVVPGTRDYQVLYLDRARYCTPETFNLTNAIEIVWAP
jgi:hypothetical protein